MNKQNSNYRLNVRITEEAANVLKAEAERMGTTMGTVVTILALDKQKEKDAVSMLKVYEQEKGKTPDIRG